RVVLAVEECPFVDSAGLRKSGSELEATAQNLREHRGAAVAVELEHRLAGVRGGRREIKRQSLVDGCAVGADKIGARRATGRKRATDDALDDARQVGAREADDAD